MYIDSVNKNGTDYTLSSFGNIIVCSNDIDDAKTVTFPNGFINTNPEPYLTFQVLFVNGHNCVDSTTYMTLNGYNVMVNKNGSLINLPIHEFTESSNIVYKSLQANTILNLFFDGTQFVVIGNPIVLSSTDYTIYANGKIGDDVIGTIKPFYLSSSPIGWLELNGSTFDSSKYSSLYSLLGTNKLPDFRECTLVGVGQSSRPNTELVAHDVYTIGQFKDDQLQGHSHSFYNVYWNDNGGDANPTASSQRAVNSETIISDGTNGTPRYGTTTHGKQIGVLYCIKAL